MTYELRENLHLSTDLVYTSYLKQRKSQSLEISWSACSRPTCLTVLGFAKIKYFYYHDCY